MCPVTRHLKRASGLLLAVLMLPAANAATPRPLQEILADYVQLGLSSNLVLATQSLQVERAEAALEGARARFWPEIGISARYTRAEGGRQLAFPVGDLLNPAYTTLNQLLVGAGQPARFPQLSNVDYPLQLPREEDSRLTLRQPLYAPGLIAGVHAARAGAEAAGFGREAYARTLKRDITRAYLEWLKGEAASAIVQSSLELLAENLRVNASLYANGKVTQDQVLRARAEWLAVQQQHTETLNAAAQAQRYLNFLLNRPLDVPLEPASPDSLVPEPPRALPDAASALLRRPELRQAAAAEAAASAQLSLARAARRPTLALGLDAGITGEHYGFGPDYNFASGSLLFSWTLFDGGARHAAVQQARIAARTRATEREETGSEVSLELAQARDNLGVAEASLATAAARADAARAAYRILERKRNEGAATQLEFLDARNALSSAELNLNRTRFDWHIRRAELDFAAATGDLR